MTPFQKLKEWIEIEKTRGSTHADYIVLATATKNAIPHSRVVAVREFSDSSLLFFTQRGTRKVFEMEENPLASATLWLPLQQREIMMDGVIHALTQDENEFYWKQLPYERQRRFASYAPTSGQAIESLETLNQKQAELSTKYPSSPIPLSDFYCGYRLEIEAFYFYTLGTDTFSEYIRFNRENNHWQQQLLSP